LPESFHDWKLHYLGVFFVAKSSLISVRIKINVIMFYLCTCKMCGKGTFSQILNQCVDLNDSVWLLATLNCSAFLKCDITCILCTYQVSVVHVYCMYIFHFLLLEHADSFDSVTYTVHLSAHTVFYTVYKCQNMTSKCNGLQFGRCFTESVIQSLMYNRNVWLCARFNGVAWKL